MRQMIPAGLAIGILATFATSNRAVSQGETTVCRPARPCIQTTAINYNRCVDLALRSGQNLSKGDRHSFDIFMYNCVAGRVGR
jgi:hypothetical protein